MPFIPCGLPIEYPARPSHGRIRRFMEGDYVDVVRGTWKFHTGRVLQWVCDPLNPVDNGGTGQSARYRLSGHEGWVYDWQLERNRPSFQEFLTWLFSLLFRLRPWKL